ncbi:hypothetical protein [Microterricola viridarii]|uniref:DUF1648 domain-containing protein n=1 Tax=Microterricola viridarii TaxID=412690 RepID=A0A1H1UDN0_9MICO|nr:hypothetical protein [Microterricola viridarii]SDS70540.1 hypothetical protein SAMN04489834_1979 [Microterricola viridarii]
MNDSTQHANPEQRAVTRSRLLLVAVVLPLAVAVASALVIISWIPTLPAVIGIHWGSEGVNDFGSPWELVAIVLGTVGLFSGVMAFSFAHLAERGRPRPAQKVLAVTSLWLSVLLSVGIAGSVATQRGLSDASTAPDPLPWLLLGALLGLVAAAAAWFLLPRADRTPPYAFDVEPLDVGPSERVFWTGTVSAARGVLLLILAVFALGIGSTLAAALGGEEVLVLVLLPLFVVLAVALTTVRWRVSVGQHGVNVVSVAGWPAIRIPLSEVADVRLIAVNPVGDFGGWGWRWNGGRTGIILQAGPAIEVTRSNGKVLVVPVDDAETAVAVLQGAGAR